MKCAGLFSFCCAQFCSVFEFFEQQRSSEVALTSCLYRSRVVTPVIGQRRTNNSETRLSGRTFMLDSKSETKEVFFAFYSAL